MAELFFIVFALLVAGILALACAAAEMQPDQPRPSSPGGRGKTVRRAPQRPAGPALPYRSKTA